MKKLILVLIKLYQLMLSPIFGKCCRFYPSCSDYAVDAISTHGALKGTWMTIKRIIKCNPLHPGGYDPVKK
ncbi:MAG TPA: membrane protein insertion efficiency factor YidD [Chlamydiales bacterium]|nr:membrane protein insertion efficiency factor YidD [Chlamydiales bacterium]